MKLKAVPTEQKQQVKRPKVVEAWMTHWQTPFITERLADGRIRRVARLQRFQDTRALIEERMRDTYGERWTGVREIQKPESVA